MPSTWTPLEPETSRKPVPVIVIPVPPATPPALGEMFVTVGVAS